MKKLTALDLQTALDECAEKRFETHSDWLSGMVNRLNAAIEGISPKPKSLALAPMPYIKKKTKIQIGNNVEPEVPCIS